MVDMANISPNTPYLLILVVLRPAEEADFIRQLIRIPKLQACSVFLINVLMMVMIIMMVIMTMTTMTTTTTTMMMMKMMMMMMMMMITRINEEHINVRNNFCIFFSLLMGSATKGYWCWALVFLLSMNIAVTKPLHGVFPTKSMKYVKEIWSMNWYFGPGLRELFSKRD